jgi:predicted dehydrogenase
MNEVKIAFHGMQGHQIHGYLPKMERCRLTAAAAIAPNRIEFVKEIAPDIEIHDDLDALLQDGVCDLISFCTQPRTEQNKLVIKAVEAGKHVIVEKPMATTLKELTALRAAVDKSGVQIRTMTPMPYEGALLGMRKLVRDGALGEIVQIFAMKSYPYNDSRPQDRRIDGGIIEQAGIHAISFIRAVTGLDAVEVFAQDTGTGNPKKGELQMGATICMRMSNGALATVLCNYCQPKDALGYHGNDQLRIHGTKGMIELVDGFNRRTLALVDGDSATEFEDGVIDVDYPQDIINCILDGTPTFLSQEDSFKNTEIVIRAQESASEGA